MIVYEIYDMSKKKVRIYYLIFVFSWVFENKKLYKMKLFESFYRNLNRILFSIVILLVIDE